jgi:hypothetical protein
LYVSLCSPSPVARQRLDEVYPSIRY